MEVITSSCVMPEAQVAAEAIFQPEQIVAHDVPASGFLPELRRIQRRQQHFLAADGVHFLAHDPRDLEQRALRQKQVAVNARGQLPDVAGAQQQLMAHHLGFGRVLAQGGNEEFAPKHGIFSVAQWYVSCR